VRAHDGAMAECRQLVEYDWLVTSTWERLHHAILDDAQTLELANEGFAPDVTLTCGRHVKHVSIPGIFTRMGTPRCQRCCDRTGLPRGTGSPKNDQECRPIVGLKLHTEEPA
jgi:hypothetical protein